MNNFYDTYYQNYYNVNDITDLSQQQGLQQDFVSAEEGLKRGNIFRNLYWPYAKHTYNFMPKNDRERQLLKIMQDSFYAHELKLYLDNHPEDRQSIDLYNQYNGVVGREMEDYNSKYAPLTLQGRNLNSSPWIWEDSPWPWEGM